MGHPNHPCNKYHDTGHSRKCAYEAPMGAGILTLAVVLMVMSCYPERQATLVEAGSLDSLGVVHAPTKVFLVDASVALFPTGFDLWNDTLRGQGWRYLSTGIVRDVALESLPRVALQIPRDSVVAMTYFEEVITVGRGFASVFHSITGSVMIPLSLICLANPKACFGSCPTVYTWNGSGWEFEAELFSPSISRLLEQEDLDKLARRSPSGSLFKLRVANEALETHYINVLQLLAVRHPAGTTAFPTVDGSVVAVRDLCEPFSAVNSEGRNVLSAIQQWDDRAYRSDSSMVRQVGSGRISDWIDLRVRPPQRSHRAALIVRLKNTLLSTVLFYEIVLGSQGVQAIEWTRRMNSDRHYATLFRSIYSHFSGVKIMIRRDGIWKTVKGIPDTGPVGWKSVAMTVPLEDDSELELRIEFFPDNIMIDYVAFDFRPVEAELPASALLPSAVRDRAGKSRSDIWPLVSEDDDRYLMTEPGDVYHFSFEKPRSGTDEVSFFVRSKGYYTEWIRGTWIATPTASQRFDLFRIDQTMTRLAALWMRERRSMELLFFRNRIPVTEDS